MVENGDARPDGGLPGLGEQAPGLGDIALIDRRVFPMADDRLHDERVEARHFAVEAGQQHLVDIERQAYRLAHSDVAERRLLHVHAEPDKIKAGALIDGESLHLGQGFGDRRWQNGEIQLARAEREFSGFRILDEIRPDLVEGGLRPLIVGIALQHRAALLFHRHDLIGPGPDRPRVMLDAALGERFFAQDAARHVGERDGEQAGVRLRQVDLAGIFAGDLDAGQARPVAFVGAVLAAGLTRQEPFEREFDVLGGHLAIAVGEHLAGFEGEFDQRRADLFQLRGRVELSLGGIGFLSDQSLMDDAQQIAVAGAAPEGRIEHRYVSLDAHRKAGFSLRPRASAESGGGGDCRSRAGGKETAA